MSTLLHTRQNESIKLQETLNDMDYDPVMGTVGSYCLIGVITDFINDTELRELRQAVINGFYSVYDHDVVMSIEPFDADNFVINFSVKL